MIQEKIAKILFSTRLMAVLFVIYAVAMAVGTFVENSYTTLTAKDWIYDAWWFEVIMVFFVINFIGNIFRYKLLSKKRWTTLILHLSFILILVGAWVTRYIGYEGIMPIREGEVADTMLSEKTYLSTFVYGEINEEPKRLRKYHKMRLAPKINNNQKVTTYFDGTPVNFEVVDFIHQAKDDLIEDENGEYYLKIVETASTGQRQDRFLKSGQVANISNVLFAFNKQTDGAVNINGSNATGFTIKSPFEGEYMKMADQSKGMLVADSIQELQLRSLYNIGGMQIVFPEKAIKGKYDIVKEERPSENTPDGVRIKVSSGGESKVVSMLGGKGVLEDLEKVEVGEFEVHLRYGSKELDLPFSIKLNDFIAEKHPGTEDRSQPSYKSYKSKVEVIDGANSYNYDIFMNNVLDHKGYRFFQASFNPDERGTILSVNHDWWGTWITYIGYFLLYFGLMAIMFDKNSRFGELKKKIDKVKKKKAQLTSLFILLFGLSAFAQTPQDSISKVDEIEQEELAEKHSDQEIPRADGEELEKLIRENAVKPAHAKKFGALVIQDYGGRMKPINTYSSQLLRKLRRTKKYAGLNSDQVLISMIENPNNWYPAPIIYLQPKNDSIHKVLGIDKGIEHVALTDFFSADGSYKLSPFLDEAYRAQVPNQFQKDFIEADERVNLLYNTLQGKFLRIFPVPNSPTNRWVSIPEIREEEEEVFFVEKDSVIVHNVFPLYMETLQLAKQNGDYDQPEELLEIISGFQAKHGFEVIPADSKVKTEILYNEIDIFNQLYKYYLLIGLLMIIAVLVKIFKEKNKLIKYTILTTKSILVILFVAHTVGLAARWYISGHAPWSNAYESMIYVAWASMFFGFAFGRKSELTLASTAFVTAIVLWVAHLNWLDPSISTLQPVLDSYWLMIHVAVIVGSYGPFLLGCVIGIVALLLMMATNQSNQKKMKLNIQELTYINEIALTVGLIMLTIGNFLGGQWANESWGRYWGWDPKETWALISIFVYAFVIHMRLVPGLRGLFAFNWASILAFGSILMTYFGVNFYLTGLHSYASGDQIISYQFIIGSILVWFVLGYFAYRKYKQFYKSKANKTASQKT